jgi:hypothetical protein
MVVEKSYRISGHESFPCRYTWLPKAVHGLSRDPALFTPEEKAMVDLGLGKNMVRSVRFWAQAAGVVTPSPDGSGYTPTDWGRSVLGGDGLDPFLEDIRTLWLIHWNLATHVHKPLLAWDYLLNRWQEPDLVRSRILKALQAEVARHEDRLSPVTLEQHLDTFLHTYVPTRGRKGQVQEDNLDCPLVELELMTKIGDRELDSAQGRREPIYGFRREEKPDITPALFAYCLNDFWAKRHPNDATLTLREVAHGYGSPGQVFKLPEEDIRTRAERLARQTHGFFSYAESAHIQQVRRAGTRDRATVLTQIYQTEVAYG